MDNSVRESRGTAVASWSPRESLVDPRVHVVLGGVDYPVVIGVWVERLCPAGVEGSVLRRELCRHRGRDLLVVSALGDQDGDAWVDVACGFGQEDCFDAGDPGWVGGEEGARA